PPDTRKIPTRQNPVSAVWADRGMLKNQSLKVPCRPRICSKTSPSEQAREASKVPGSKSGSPGLNSAASTARALFASEALNGIQVRVTMMKVTTANPALEKHRRMKRTWGWLNRSTKRYMPCRPPQNKNINEAPCHRPPSSMVSKRLRLTRKVEPRFPPNGMYR